MAFSYLTTVLATAPIAHYPLNETSGTAAVDATGNGNNAAYSGTKTLNQTGIVADGPSVLFGAAGKVTLPNIDISNRSYAVGGFIKLSSLVDVRYFFQAYNANSANHNLHSYITAGGILTHNYFFDDYNTVTQKIFAATVAHIVLRYDTVTDESTTWVNGVLAATGAGKGPLTLAPSLLHFGMDQFSGNTWSGANAQHLTIWRDTIPSNADIAALYAARVNAGDQPPTPAAFTVPVTASTYDASIAVAWPVTAGATSYDLDYSANGGGAWTNIVTANGTNGYTWNTSALAEGAYLLRVRASNSYGTSAYRTSGSFSLDHPPPPVPGAITAPTAGQVISDLTFPAAFGSSAGADSYDIDYSLDNGGSWSSSATGVVTTTPTIDATAWTASPVARIRVRSVSSFGSSDWVVSDAFTIVRYTPGLNFLEDGLIFEDDHRVADPAVPALADYTWTDGNAPDPAKWEAQGVGLDRWRIGHGFDAQYPYLVVVDRGGGVTSVDLAFAGPLLHSAIGLSVYNGGFVTDYAYNSLAAWVEGLAFDTNYLHFLHNVATTGALATDEAHNFTPQVFLQSLMDARSHFGGLVELAWGTVFLFRDPVTGAGLTITGLGQYPSGSAYLRWFDGVNFFARLAGKVTYPDGHVLNPSHLPYDDTFGLRSQLFSFDVNADTGDVVITFESGYLAGTTLEANIASELSGMEGAFAYALLEYNWLDALFYGVTVTKAQYVEVSGLQPGWVVKGLQRTWETRLVLAPLTGQPFHRDTVHFYRIYRRSAIADVDGFAYLKRDVFETEDVAVADMPEGASEADATTPLKYYGMEIWIDDVTVMLVHEADITAGDRYLLYTPGMSIPAYAPVSVITPASRDVVSESPFTVEIEEHDPVHESEAVEYQGEYAPDGVTWGLLFDWQSSPTYDWDHSAVAFSYAAKIRVRARGATTHVASGWRESDTFVVFHPGEATLEAEATDITRASVTDQSVLLQVADAAAAGLKSVRWQIWDSTKTHLRIDVTKTAEKRLTDWITGLASGTLYFARYKIVDFADVEGDWSPWMDFTTTRMNATQPHYAKDERGNIRGNFRNVNAPFIDGTALGIPEFPAVLKYLPSSSDRVGVKLNMSGSNLSQTPDSTHHMIRFSDPILQRFKGGGHRNGFTAMLFLIPMDLGAAREIMGQPGDHFAYHDASGHLYYVINASADGQETGNIKIPFGGNGSNSPSTESLTIDELCSVFIGGGDPYFNGALAVTGVGAVNPQSFEYLTPKPPEDEVKLSEAWTGLNGTWLKTNLGSIVGYEYANKWPIKHSHPQTFDVGHGSTNADGADDLWANGKFGKFVAVAWAYWDTLLTAAEVSFLDEFKTNEALLDAYIATMDTQPLVYSKINEYPAPRRVTPRRVVS